MRPIKLISAAALFIAVEMAGLALLQSELLASKAAATELRPDTPIRLVIPAIGVDANIQDVGLEPDGAMGTPKQWKEVGWYNQGPRPGEEGSAVMVGHLDTDKDNGGVFWDLRKLKPGDRIYVIDKTNEARSFIVRDKQTYDAANAPIKTIFTSLSGRNLNLITCSGTWLVKNGSYNQRLVVFAEAVK